MIRAVFFDFDGTLCDSKDAWQIGLNASLDQFAQKYPGRRQELADAWKQVSPALLVEVNAGRLQMQEAIERRYPDTLRSMGIDDPELGAALNLTLSQTRLEAMSAMPGAIDVLATLRSRYHLGIITNGSAADYPDSQTTAIRHIGLEDRVDTVWISDAVGVRKPDTRIFEVAMEAANVEPAAAIYIGDSVSKDIVGAQNAGMHSVLIDPAGHFDSASVEAQPGHVVQSLTEVVDIIDSLG